MERLTYDFCVMNAHCWQIKGADNLECREVCENQDDLEGCKTCPIAKAFNRLAEIENILGDEYNLDRLRELVEAERDGRCIILRFKPGMFIYRVWPRCDRRKSPFMTSHYLDCKEACIEAQLWNDVYGSEEAAKAALNKLKEAEME